MGAQAELVFIFAAISVCLSSAFVVARLQFAIFLSARHRCVILHPIEKSAAAFLLEDSWQLLHGRVSFSFFLLWCFFLNENAVLRNSRIEIVIFE